MRHLVAFGASVAGFTALALLCYIALVCASGFDIGSPIMPLLVPMIAVAFSFAFTLAVVIPPCVIGEWLFVRALRWPWILVLTGTVVLFIACLGAAFLLDERYDALPEINLPTLARWICVIVPFAIYWPVSRRARV